MKLSEKEKAALRAAFRDMSPRDRLDYIYTYYKWPILLGLIALIILSSAVYRRVTQKEPLVYVAVANVAMGDELETELTAGYLDFRGADPRKQEVFFYKDLYLSDDPDPTNHEYYYASRLKVMGAVQAQKMDLLLMNREAYDYLSQGGYLLDLSALLEESESEYAPELLQRLTENEVVLSDNTVDYLLREADSVERVTETVKNGVPVSDLPLFARAGVDGELFVGIIGNCPRTEEAIRYLGYLLGTG